MKIRRLELRKFGHFDGTVLDLESDTVGAAGAAGLHVVYGPNEAGKSTALDAIKYSLYGMPSGSSNDPAYDFRFAKKDIRTAMSLALDDGSELAFARNRGRTVSILDFETDEADPALADRLAGVLRGVPRAVWSTRHGLDQESLRTGSRALLEGSSTSEALFAVATGMVGARQLLDAIRTARQAMLPDFGRGGTLSAALTKLRDAANDFRSAQREAGGFDAAAERLDRVLQEIGGVRAAHAVAVSERDRLERASAARALLAQHVELAARRAAIELSLSSWSDREHEQFVEARTTLQRVSVPIAMLTERITDVTRQMDALRVDPLVAALADEVDALNERVASTREAHERIAALEMLATDAGEAADIDALRRQLAGIDAAIAAVSRVDEGSLLRDELRLAGERSTLDATAVRLVPTVRNVRQLSEVAFPSERAVADFEARFAATDAELTEATASLERADAERRQHDETLHELLAKDGDVPDQDTLVGLREQRRLALDVVRNEIANPSLDALGAVDQLDASMKAVDHHTDLMLAQAERAGVIRELRERLRRDSERIAAATAAVEALQQQRDMVVADWEALWQPTGIPVAAVEDMREVRAEAMRVLERDRALAELAVEIGARRAQIQQSARTLAASLRHQQDSELAVLLDVARAHRAHVTEQISREERRLSDLRELTRAHQVIDRFGADVRALLARAGETVDADFDPIAALLRLRARVRAAVNDANTAAQLESRRAGDEQQLAIERAARAGALGLIDTLLDTTGCANADDLATQAARWQDRLALDREIADVEREMFRQSRMSSSELAALLAESDGAEFARRIALARATEDELADRLVQLESEQRVLDQSVGAIGRDTTQAAARVRLQDARAELERLLPEYRQLVLQERILQGLLDEVAQRERGPLVERASRYVAALTLGRWLRLVTGIDDRGVEQAQLERASDGALVAIDDLSEGTRDQLYLALRLAELVDSADRGERMPLVVDDVLLTSDDERAAATFQLLAEVSEHFQILFFTHHEHLLEIAATTLGPDTLRVHRLDELAQPAAVAI